MVGYSGWSYRPYKPLLWNSGDIYVCRVAPEKNSIHLEWLPVGPVEYSIFYRDRTVEKGFLLAGTTAADQFDITGLDSDTDYEFFVSAQEKKSRIRLARTGHFLGSLVNYLHPDDDVYSFSGRCLCSPSLVRHPDGYLLASMDLYSGGFPQNLTLIYRSDDNGASWHYVSELMPCFWGKLFIHNGDLYMLACSTGYGDLLIGRSTDGGKTFGTPTVLLRGSNGKKGVNGIHKNPQNLVVYNNRLYETLEWGNWINEEYYHAAMVMSCHVEDDLLVPENWHFSQPLKHDPNWEGLTKGPHKGTIEGTLCVAPDGKLYNVMRFNTTLGCDPLYGVVPAFRVNTDDPDAPLEYSHGIQLPCNHTKFMIKFDSVSQRYYCIGNRILSPAHYGKRDVLTLFTSRDMRNWEVLLDIIDMHEENGTNNKIGFQYCDFEFDGEDIIFLCRTCMNNGDSFHNTNASTFHRIQAFRTLLHRRDML